VIGGLVLGASVTIERVTWADGTTENIYGSSPFHDAEDATGDTIGGIQIPPYRGIKKLEFKNEAASDRVCGWQVVVTD